MLTVTLDQLLDLAHQLSPRDQARLVVRLAPVLERALDQPLSRPRPDFLGYRSIAATTVHLGVPLISRDRKIRSSSVPTIW